MEIELAQKKSPGIGEIGTIFTVLGIQSFGGGSSTFYLIHKECMDRGWLSEDEFIRSWALAQIAPGINLVKLTMMVGFRLRGWPGLIVAVGGLLLPSAMVTVLMTAGFTVIRSVPLVQAIMKGVLPAAIGLSLANATQMAQPLFKRAHREGPVRLGTHVLILLASAYLLAALGVSPILILFLAGGVAILLLAVIHAANRDEVDA